jgi:DNA primase small subunit
MLDDKVKRFAIGKISEYYATTAKFAIPSLEKREFGIGNIKKIDARHLCFNSEQEFRGYLVSNTPLFVSHSAAFYERPGATPIDKKGWLGAELIFDLDLHADGKYGVYAILDKVREDAINLVEKFLVDDFGVDRKNIIIVFSGNRGYHIHVRDPDYFDLGIEERREIADYINGTGLNYRNFFEEIEIPGRKLTKKVGPKPSDHGYRGRFARAVIEKLEKEPKTISTVFSNDEKRTKFVDGIINGDWNKTSIADIIERLEPIAKELPVHSIDTDVGVTQDVSKLIRVPNSIHGETGLIAKIVDDITTFKPLDDAIAFDISGKKTITITFTEDVPKLDFGKTSYPEFKKDEKKELPEALAMFFMLKGSAIIS